MLNFITPSASRVPNFIALPLFTDFIRKPFAFYRPLPQTGAPAVRFFSVARPASCSASSKEPSGNFLERHSAAISDRALRVLRALAEASPPFRPRLFASSLLSSPFRMGLKFSSFTSPHFFRRIFVHRPPKKTTYTASKASQMYAGMNTCHQSMSARFVSFNMISATCEHSNTVIRITCNQKDAFQRPFFGFLSRSFGVQLGFLIRSMTPYLFALMHLLPTQ